MKKIQELLRTAAASDKFWVGVIFIALFALFSPALACNALISDDLVYYLHARSLDSSLKNCFAPVLDLRTPLTALSLYLNYLTAGEENFVFHARLTNIFLHCGSALLFFALLRRLRWQGKEIPPVWAGITALIFAIHPQRVESVVWIAERKDVLAMCAGLGALLFFLLALKKEKISWLSPLLLILSLSAKPMWIFFPVSAAALIWSQYRTFSLKRYLKFLSPSLLIAAGTVFLYLVSISKALQKSMAFQNSVSASLKLEIICHNYGSYFLKTFIPGELSPLYPFYTPEGFARLAALIPLCVLLLCIVMYKKNPAFLKYGILPLICCYIASLLPVAGFIRIGNADFADRYSYAPSLFLLTGAMYVLLYLSEKFSLSSRLLLLAAGGYCVILLFRTSFYIPVWSDPERVTAHALRPQIPNSSIAISHAAGLYHKGKFDEMFQFLNSRLPERPHYSRSHNHMIRLFKISATGLALIRSGREAEGIRHLNIVYSIDGNGVIKNFPLSFLHEIFTVGASYYLKQKKAPETAAAIYKGGARIIKHYSVQYEHYYNGLAALTLKDHRKAAELFKLCLAFAPDSAEYRKKYEEALNTKKGSTYEPSK